MKNEDVKVNLFYWMDYRVYRCKLAKAILLDKISFNGGYKKLNTSKVEEYTEEHPVFRKFKDLVKKEHIYRKQKLTLDSIS